MKKTLLSLILLFTAWMAHAQGGGYGYNAGAAGYGYSQYATLADCDLNRVIASMSGQSFESTRLTIARQGTANYYLSCAQVARVMRAFTFESTRMDYAVEVWSRCVDPAQVYLIYDAFDFELSIDEFNRKAGVQGNCQTTVTSTDCNGCGGGSWSYSHSHSSSGHVHSSGSSHVSGSVSGSVGASAGGNVGINYGAVACGSCGVIGCTGTCYVAPAPAVCGTCGVAGCYGNCALSNLPPVPACGYCGVVGCNGNCYVPPAPTPVPACGYCGVMGCNGSCYVPPPPAPACNHCGVSGCAGACVTVTYTNGCCDDFEAALSSIREKSFDSSRLTVAKQITAGRRLTSIQVRRIMEVFSFESTKLEYAKFAYVYVSDPWNYYLVNDAFTFSSSIHELDEHLMAYR